MIGIFDSGVGGLTVVKELKRLLPEAGFIYLGDNARTPYGNRSRETIEKYAKEDVDFLIAKGAKVIVVACNTASALAGEFLKNNYDLPIFNVIEPAAKRAVEVSRGRIGVIGTRGTVGSGAYEKAIKKNNSELKVFSRACPLLVPLIEEDCLSRKETKTILKKYLQPLKTGNIDTLILGCTHYPLLKELIKVKIGRRVALVDPAEEVIKQLQQFLSDSLDFTGSQDFSDFYITDTDSRFKVLAEKWLGEKVNLNKISL